MRLPRSKQHRTHRQMSVQNAHGLGLTFGWPCLGSHLTIKDFAIAQIILKAADPTYVLGSSNPFAASEWWASVVEKEHPLSSLSRSRSIQRPLAGGKKPGIQLVTGVAEHQIAIRKCPEHFNRLEPTAPALGIPSSWLPQGKHFLPQKSQKGPSSPIIGDIQ